MKQPNGFVSWLKALTCSSFRTVLQVGESVTKKTLIGCISGAGMHKSRATKFWTVVPNICEPSGAWNFEVTHSFLENLVGIETGCECTGWWRLRIYCEHFSWSKPCLVFCCGPECASLLCKILGKFSKVKQLVSVTHESFINLSAVTDQPIFWHLCLADQCLQTALGQHKFLPTCRTTDYPKISSNQS